VQVGCPLLSPRRPMIATLIVSFGLRCARRRAGSTARPTLAAAVFERKARRSIMAVPFRRRILACDPARLGRRLHFLFERTHFALAFERRPVLEVQLHEAPCQRERLVARL